MITFLDSRIQKKSEKPEPAFSASVLAYFPRARKTVAFLDLHFGADEPLSSSFLESHNLDAERPASARCSRRTK